MSTRNIRSIWKTIPAEAYSALPSFRLYFEQRRKLSSKLKSKHNAPIGRYYVRSTRLVIHQTRSSACTVATASSFPHHSASSLILIPAMMTLPLRRDARWRTLACLWAGWIILYKSRSNEHAQATHMSRRACMLEALGYITTQLLVTRQQQQME